LINGHGGGLVKEAKASGSVARQHNSSTGSLNVFLPKAFVLSDCLTDVYSSPVEAYSKSLFTSVCLVPKDGPCSLSHNETGEVQGCTEPAIDPAIGLTI
jgi:hypothetical protein